MLEIPIPRILAWSTDRNNPVGAEYILEKIAPGKPLGRLWQNWNDLPIEPRYNIIEQIVEIERKLASTKLQKSGCIYFREDFPAGDVLVTTPSLPSSAAQRFTVGPLVESTMWRGPKAFMDLSRGPCKSSYN